MSIIFQRMVFVMLAVVLISACAGKAKNNGNSQYQQFMSGSSRFTVESKDVEEKSSEDYFKLGQQAYNELDEDKALYYYVKALEKDEKNLNALLLIGDIHEKRGNLEVAKKAFELSLQVLPDNIESQERLGFVLLKLAKYQEAQSVLMNVIKQDAKRSKALSGLGIVADINGQFGQAKNYYQAALELQPESTDILNNLAFSLYLDGEWFKADERYQQLLTLDNNHKQGNLNYGLLLSRLGDTKKALYHFEKVLDKAAALNEIGYIYFLEKRYPEAEQLFEMAIAASPSYFKKAYQNLKAVRNFQKGLIDPSVLENSVKFDVNSESALSTLKTSKK